MESAPRSTASDKKIGKRNPSEQQAGIAEVPEAKWNLLRSQLLSQVRAEVQMEIEAGKKAQSKALEAERQKVRAVFNDERQKYRAAFEIERQNHRAALEAEQKRIQTTLGGENRVITDNSQPQNGKDYRPHSKMSTLTDSKLEEKKKHQNGGWCEKAWAWVSSRTPIPDQFFDNRTKKPIRPIPTLVPISFVMHLMCVIVAALAMFFYIRETTQVTETVFSSTVLDGHDCSALQKVGVRLTIPNLPVHSNCTFEDDDLQCFSVVSSSGRESVLIYFSQYSECDLDDPDSWTLEFDQSALNNVPGGSTANFDKAATFYGFRANQSSTARPYASHRQSDDIVWSGWNYDTCASFNDSAPRRRCDSIPMRLVYNKDRELQLVVTINQTKELHRNTEPGGSCPWCQCSGVQELNSAAGYVHTYTNVQYEWHPTEFLASRATPLASNKYQRAAKIFDGESSFPGARIDTASGSSGGSSTDVGATKDYIPGVRRARSRSRPTSTNIRLMLNTGAPTAVTGSPATISPLMQVRVITWGSSSDGGSIPSTTASALSSGVQTIYSTDGAFAALKTDGSVVAWGFSSYGGSIPSTTASALSSGVQTIYSTWYAFAALKTDGSVVAWVESFYGGSIPSTTASALSSEWQIPRRFFEPGKNR